MDFSSDIGGLGDLKLIYGIKGLGMKLKKRKENKVPSFFFSFRDSNYYPIKWHELSISLDDLDFPIFSIHDLASLIPASCSWLRSLLKWDGIMCLHFIKRDCRFEYPNSFQLQAESAIRRHNLGCKPSIGKFWKFKLFKIK